MAEAIFEVTVSGTYISEDSATGKKVRRQYPSQKIRIEESNLAVAVPSIKKHFLPVVLKKLDTSFVRVRTVFVEETRPITKGANLEFLPEEQRVRLMSRADLIKFARVKKIDLVADYYPTTQALRDALHLGLQSPKKLALKQERDGKTMGAHSRMLALNPQLAGGAAPVDKPPVSKEELIEIAKGLGIKATAAWGEDTIKEKIKEARIAKQAEEAANASNIDNGDGEGAGATVEEGNATLISQL